ncbi:acetyl-CoA carboxylase [Pseudodonghicola sp. IC7]|uniref:Biotin carboxyl carrier protein of acetyl-CoA carboxylase n=1 Tax=Pseudodonghicola flavimaris TaxID=3050036 RepID=A0ABT7F5G4_9RHOB|nr:acetyl-CoA carboxylase [Pseudodonghicola flavimaris]
MQTIEAPLPGILYHKPSPDAEPFKTPGDAVAVGDTLALIEVMKSFMPVEAELAGTFKGYSAADGESIEPGAPVCEIEQA